MLEQQLTGPCTYKHKTQEEQKKITPKIGKKTMQQVTKCGWGETPT